MENNQSNITEETKSNENLETPNEQAQQKEKTFSQEEVSQMIKDRLAREKGNLMNVLRMQFKKLRNWPK